MDQRPDTHDLPNDTNSSTDTTNNEALGPAPAPPCEMTISHEEEDILHLSPASSHLICEREEVSGPAPAPLRGPTVQNEQEDDSDIRSAASNSLPENNQYKSRQPSLAERQKANWWSRLINNTWGFEGAAVALSISSLIAITVVLRVYENKPTHPLAYGITLNAIISTLGTASKTPLLCAIAGCLGQLKWDWFRTERRLYDLAALDDATRGPAGSISLLLERPRGALATLAAVITILALIFDPFVQQIVRYPTRSTTAPNEVATTRKAFGFRADPASTELISAFNSGLWADSAQFDRTPSCSSGNCEWRQFSSLGWCSKCEDVTTTAKLKGACSHNGYGFINGTCNISVGIGDEAVVVQGSPGDGDAYFPTPWLNLTSEIVWATTKMPVPSIFAGDLPPRLYNMTIAGIQGPVVTFAYASLTYDFHPAYLYLKNFSTQIAFAEHCVLTPCLRSYKLRTSKGVVDAQVETINYGITKYISFWEGLNPANRESCWQPSKEDITYKNPGEYSGPANLTEDFWSYENRSVPAFCPVAQYAHIAARYLTSKTSIRWYWSHDGGEGRPYQSTNSSDSIRVVAEHNLSYITNNIAASLSNLALDVSGETVTGIAHISETYVLVRWEWLILPIALVAAGMFLFLTTVLRTSLHHHNLWRCSLLPLLYHRLDIPVTAGGPIPVDVARMALQAHKTKSKLNSSADDDESSLPRQA